ncbi:MAG: hypothetical protein E6230_03110 [Paenibacillus dendritiformis]|uniref:hypothetical protein n=1 Tax=Paenibacillus dendritiformis TaxID=130049 RepID=UPI001B04F88B|nr:hypothetical protein [Paenibacillus dendritiformis]MDU5141162.1 hypothetical protein [Paenibacillus dendritiformis]GIO74466.1 hypothetical protein J27TS7_39800 [Paenibacillus dendritiformis]
MSIFMKKYGKVTLLLVVVFIIGALYIPKLNHTAEVISFNQLVKEHVKEEEIEYLFLSKAIQGESSRDSSFRIYDKEERERVLQIYSKIEMKREDRPERLSQRERVYLNFGNVYGLQYVIMVTDLGIVDTFHYKTNKGGTYRITNDFDFGTIRRLSEPEPGAGNASAGFFCYAFCTADERTLHFYETLSLQKNNNEPLLFLRDALR